MKHLTLILTIIFMSFNALAKEDGQGKVIKDCQVLNLNYDVVFEKTTGDNLDFCARYYLPFEGTKFEQKMYVTKEEEMFFWDEAHHWISPDLGEVEKIYSDNVYVLAPFKSNGKKVGSLTISHTKAKIGKENNVKKGVWDYKGMQYTLDKIKLSEGYYIFPIEKESYANHMGLITNRPYLYIFVPINEAKLKVENVCGNLTIYSSNIQIMKLKYQ